MCQPFNRQFGPTTPRDSHPMSGIRPELPSTEEIVSGFSYLDVLSGKSRFEGPGWVMFVARLPTTGTQKVQKTQIFPKAENPRRQPGALDLRERKKRR